MEQFKSEQTDEPKNELDIPPQYKGLDADTLESIWTIPEYVDREKTKQEKEKRQQALDSLREKENNKIIDEIKIEELREKLGIIQPVSQEQISQDPPIKYVEVVIDNEYMQKNLMPNNGLRMKGGQANWNGEVELVKYTLDSNLSEEYRTTAEDKLEKFNKGQEKTYQHEAHHIRNRENNLTPHVAAENLREFLTFRVLDELSAFSIGQLYNQHITSENILDALQKAKQDIENSYYGEPFQGDAKWYTSQHGNKPEVFSRTINQEKYHKIMRQYFNFKGKDILTILQQENKMSEFTEILNGLIGKLDQILNSMKN